MLILRRKVNQSIVIGDITITICAIEGAATKRVKIGIVAPEGIQVLREEVVTSKKDGTNGRNSTQTQSQDGTL